MAIREAELEGRGYQVWAAARGESNFQQFAPVLKEIVALKREIAAVTHPVRVVVSCIHVSIYLAILLHTHDTFSFSRILVLMLETLMHLNAE